MTSEYCNNSVDVNPSKKLYWMTGDFGRPLAFGIFNLNYHLFSMRINLPDNWFMSAGEFF